MHQVSIYIKGQAHVTVSETVSNRQDIHPKGDEQGNMAVPQTVGAYPMNASHRRMAVDDTPNGIPSEWVTVPAKDKVRHNVTALHAAPAFEIFKRERIEGYRTPARLGLGGR